ncbi:Calcineurin-like phosphoesterase [seawater metagenome]|uniref:Calcineurin-like phosphoesterase n=1 Tax=seawater metagenome TaxID=1561972 RepID=A0A5E8CHJ6_9ZZZZ
MKFSKLLEEIKSKMDSSLVFINYHDLKKQIHQSNFINLLQNEILEFDCFYANINTKNPNKTYEFILINYLAINKLIKKFKKYNNVGYQKDFKEIEINNFLRHYKFFKDITELPEHFNYKINKTCPICLDKCTFPITTECGHTYCWKCLLIAQLDYKNCPYCKKETNIDPAMIVLNNLIKCDSKYSPFNNQVLEDCIKLDLVSDLHVDQWSHIYKTKYPCGQVKEYPFKFALSDSKYLVIAGDICDNLEDSIKYVNDISQYYEKILFVDGNHEHVYAYPKLFDKKKISKMINNNKVIYLPDNSYKIKDTVFIGSCGWWDYNDSNPRNIQNCLDYFKDWIKDFTEKETLTFINSVIQKSKEEYQYLNSELQKYEKDETVKNVIIVTHTLPSKKYCDRNDNQEFNTDDFSSQYNTKFKKLLNYRKISHWFFGHTHKQWDDKVDNIHFISNPRGRPEDFNREEYFIKQISII